MIKDKEVRKLLELLGKESGKESEKFEVIYRLDVERANVSHIYDEESKPRSVVLKREIMDKDTVSVFEIEDIIELMKACVEFGNKGGTIEVRPYESIGDNGGEVKG